MLHCRRMKRSHLCAYCSAPQLPSQPTPQPTYLSHSSTSTSWRGERITSLQSTMFGWSSMHSRSGSLQAEESGRGGSGRGSCGSAVGSTGNASARLHVCPADHRPASPRPALTTHRCSRARCSESSATEGHCRKTTLSAASSPVRRSRASTTCGKRDGGSGAGGHQQEQQQQRRVRVRVRVCGGEHQRQPAVLQRCTRGPGASPATEPRHRGP